MEIIIKIVSVALLIGLILSPIIIYWVLVRINISYKFIVYLIIGILTTSIITLIFAWWNDASNQFLLNYYGYSFDAMNDSERYGNVSNNNFEKVKILERSIMGIGWPLKAFLTYILYFPYLVLVYLLGYFFRKKLAKQEIL